MKTLEITPLKDKRLRVIIVEKEYNEPFWIVNPPPTLTNQKLRMLYRPSIAFYTFLEKLIKRVKPDFATEELGMRSQKEFYEENTLTKLFKKFGVPLFPVDIDEYARGYLATNLEEKSRLRDRILNELTSLSERRKGGEPSLEEEYLVAYAQSLQKELEEEEREISFPVRERWIVMGILENAKKIEGKNEVTCLHISSPEHVEGVKNLLESVDAEVEVLKISKEVSTPPEAKVSGEISDLLHSMEIRVKPIVKKASEESPYILFLLDVDERASPFDVCMAYDAGFNAVIPYENVTPEEARKIVQDVMFSRGPKGIKYTCFFIGGRNQDKAEEVLEIAKSTMFPPFEAPIIIDPRGAYTTAAAMIAKVEETLASKKLGDLKDKSCAVFGTGPVGRIAAVLLARLGCEVTIVSTNPKRVNGEEYINEIAKSLLKRYGVSVNGAFAPTPEDRLQILKKADVIFCATAPGVRIIDAWMLKELKLMKLIVDINAVPPLGVEGMKPDDDGREIAPGIFGVGALAVGKLKHKLEIEILREARRNGKKIYDYNYALQLARALLQRKMAPAELKLTLKYSSAKKG